MSLLFNMLCRLVIALLPRSKHLSISWVQSPSTVTLEPKKIKYFTVSIVSPSVCHEVMGQAAEGDTHRLTVFLGVRVVWGCKDSWDTVFSRPALNCLIIFCSGRSYGKKKKKNLWLLEEFISELRVLPDKHSPKSVLPKMVSLLVPPSVCWLLYSNLCLPLGSLVRCEQRSPWSDLYFRRKIYRMTLANVSRKVSPGTRANTRALLRKLLLYSWLPH